MTSSTETSFTLCLSPALMFTPLTRLHQGWHSWQLCPWTQCTKDSNQSCPTAQQNSSGDNLGSGLTGTQCPEPGRIQGWEFAAELSRGWRQWQKAFGDFCTALPCPWCESQPVLAQHVQGRSLPRGWQASDGTIWAGCPGGPSGSGIT